MGKPKFVIQHNSERIRLNGRLLAAWLVGAATTLVGMVAIRSFAGRDVPPEGPPRAQEAGCASTRSARVHDAQLSAEEIAVGPTLSPPTVAAKAMSPIGASPSDGAPPPLPRSRTSPFGKSPQFGGRRASAAAGIAPTPGAQRSEQRSESSQGWEDER